MNVKEKLVDSKPRMKKILWSVARFCLFFMIGFIVMYPVLQIVTRAIMPVNEYTDPSVIWIPKELTLENLKAAWILMDYGNSFVRTLILCVGSAILQVISSAIVGYGFARFRFKLRGPLFALVIVSIVVPTQLLLVPSVVQYRFFDFFGISHLIALFTGESYTNYTINLNNTYWTFFLPSALGVGVRSGLFIYIFRQFFRNMPKDLEDAASVDGCGPWKTFLRVMAPNAKSSALTVFLFSIVWHWNENMLTNSLFATGNKTLAVLMQAYADPYTNENNIANMIAQTGLYATSITGDRNVIAGQGIAYGCMLLFLLPPLILYIFAQKFFVEGVETSGIKG